MQGSLGRENNLDDLGPATQHRLQETDGSGVGEGADATSSAVKGIESSSERRSEGGPKTLDSVPGSATLREADNRDLRMEQGAGPTDDEARVDANGHVSATPADNIVYDSPAGGTVRPQGFSLWGFIVGADRVRK